MLPDVGLLLLSMILAAVAGFAAAQGGTCAVRAIEDVMDGRGAALFVSFARCSAWAAAIALPLAWLMVPGAMLGPARSAAWPAAAGGLLFGIGAALNGGCAFSTISRLGAGDLAKVFALPGFGLGSAASLPWTTVLPKISVSHGPLVAPHAWSILLLGGVWIWAVRETMRLRRPAVGPRLDRAAAALALACGALHVLHGRWEYAEALEQGAAWAARLGPLPSALPLLLFVATLGGAVLSALQRGDIKLTAPTARASLGSLGGGILMGIGAAMVPGGNDALLLRGLPELLPHAMVAYAALVAGATATLLALRALRIRCTVGEVGGAPA